MKKRLNLIPLIIVLMILNFMVFELIKNYGSSNPFHPFKTSFTKAYFPLLILIILPLLALIFAPVVALFKKNMKSFKTNFGFSYIETLLFLNGLILLWMPLTGFL